MRLVGGVVLGACENVGGSINIGLTRLRWCTGADPLSGRLGAGVCAFGLAGCAVGVGAILLGARQVRELWRVWPVGEHGGPDGGVLLRPVDAAVGALGGQQAPEEVAQLAVGPGPGHGLPVARRKDRPGHLWVATDGPQGLKVGAEAGQPGPGLVTPDAVARRAGGRQGAAETLANSADDTEAVFLEVAAAKIRVGEAVEAGAAIAHQVHGAIGFTAEHILQRYSRRCWGWRDDFGTESVWARDLGERVIANGPDALWPMLATR